MASPCRTTAEEPPSSLACWAFGVPPNSTAAGSPGCLLVGMRMPLVLPEGIHLRLAKYGHIWAVIERLFACLVLPWRLGLAPKALHVVVPATSINPFERVAVNGELLALLDGTRALRSRSARLRIHRHDAAPVCSTARPAACCASRYNASAWLHGMRHEHGTRCAGGVEEAQLRILDLLPHREPVGSVPAFDGHAGVYLPPSQLARELLAPSAVDATRHGLRTVAWENLGARSALRGEAGDLVLLVSNEGAPNGRRIADEAGLERALRAHFRRTRPELQFARHRFDELEYPEEVRLFSRAAVVVSLFGSALHNCRFMRPGSLAVELHGALRRDFLDGYTGYWYGQLCSGMGVTWLPVAVPGGVPTKTVDTASFVAAPLYALDRPDDYGLARVNTSEVLRALERESRGEWPAALRDFDEHAVRARLQSRGERVATRVMADLTTRVLIYKTWAFQNLTSAALARRAEVAFGARPQVAAGCLRPYAQPHRRLDMGLGVFVRCTEDVVRT